MLKKTLPLVLGLALVAPAVVRTQGNVASLVGTWKLEKSDPPLEGRGGPGGGGGGGGGRGAAPGGGAADGGAAYNENVFTAAPAMMVISQSGNMLAVQVGAQKETFTLDDKLTVVPEGDLNALKTHAHWEGGTLHLHFKQGMNFGRDVLSASGATLTVVRDLESGGGSTTRTLTYTKTS
jgi:hypothetical protein